MDILFVLEYGVDVSRTANIEIWCESVVVRTSSAVVALTLAGNHPHVALVEICST